MMRTDDDYKDSSALTNWTKGFLYAGITLSVAGIGSNALEYQLLAGISDGFYPGDAALEASDARQLWIARARFFVYLLTAILVLMWIYRANFNARRLGARGLKFSPAGSIGWYFVPVYSLWRPYRALKEIWQASMDPEDWRAKPVPSLLPVWWAFWLISIPLGSLSWRLQGQLDDSSGIEDLIAVNAAAQVGGVWEIPLTLLLLALINRIHQMQVEHRRVSRNPTSGASSADLRTELR